MRRAPLALQLTTLGCLAIAATSSATAAETRPATAAAVPPLLETFVAAAYPPRGVAAGVEAEVILDISIDAAGSVTAVGIRTPSEHPGYGFEEAARAAAERFAFKPATRAGRPIPSRILYRYSFTLTKAPPESAPETLPGDTATPGDDKIPTTSPTGAPPITFSGRVRVKGTREPVTGALVLLVGLEREVETDKEGAFALRGVPPGEHEVRIAAATYDTLVSTETVRADERTEVTYYLRPSSTSPWRTTIRAARSTKEVSHHALDAEELATIPGTAGEPIRAIAILPGVSRGPFGGGLLIIRGSAPEDTRFFIMGHDIPLPFHFGGVATSFNPRLIKRMDFYPGGFGPQWGSATGGIIDLEPRDASARAYHGVVELDLFDAGALLEGPITKKVAFAVAFRRSYIDALLPLVVPDNDTLSFVAAPRYSDYQAMLDIEASHRDRIKLLFFGSAEQLKLLLDNPSVPDPAVRGELFGKTAFQRFTARWRHRHRGGLLSELSIAGGPSSVDVAAGEDLFLTLRNFDVSSRYELSLPLASYLDLTIGARVTFERMRIDVRAPRPPTNGGIIAPIGGSMLFEDAEVRHVFDGAVYVEGRLRPTDDIQIAPGLRVDYFGLTNDASIDPRLLVRWRVDSALTLKTSAGLFHKSPEPQELSGSFGDPGLGSERAVHLVIGAEATLPIGAVIDVALFYKWLDNLVLRAPSGESSAEATSNVGEGQALGAELLVKLRPTKWLMGWVSYTFSRSSRTLFLDGELVVRPFQYDHTHVVSVLARVELGKGWSLGLRWSLNSGAPFTRAAAGYYDADGDLYGPLAGDPNGSRIPAFHQLDIRVDKKFVFNWATLEIYLEVMNTYNRSNREQPLYSFDYREQDYFRGLPIIPSFGIAGKF